MANIASAGGGVGGNVSKGQSLLEAVLKKREKQKVTGTATVQAGIPSYADTQPQTSDVSNILSKPRDKKKEKKAVSATAAVAAATTGFDVEKPDFTADDVWAEWLQISKETEDEREDEDVLGQRDVPWWEYADEYPKKFTPEEIFGSGVVDTAWTEGEIEAWAQAEVAEEAETEKEEKPSLWENIQAWAKKTAEKVVDVAVSVVEPVEENPVEAVPAFLNYLWGWPFGEEDRGKFWKAVPYYGFQFGEDALKRVVGMAMEMGTVPRLSEGGGEWLGLKYALLMQGNYVEAVEEQFVPGTMTEEEREREIEAARKAQEEFNRLFEKYKQQGLSDTEAMYRAGQEAAEKEEYGIVASKPWFGGESTPESPIPWSEEVEKAWDLSAGFRYSHAIRPELRDAFLDLLEKGVSPAEAGRQTEDPIVELAAGLLMDPYWVLPVDNLIVGAVWGAVKEVADVLVDIGLKVPVIKGGLQWAGELTARTNANYAARYVDDALHFIRGYADRIGADISEEFVERILKNPPVDMLRDAPSYYCRAIRNAADYIDEVLAALRKTFSDDALEAAIKKKAAELARVTAEKVDPDEIVKLADKELWDKALRNASLNAYAAAVKAYTKAHPTVGKVLRASKPIQNVLQFGKGLMVDTWLGLRPSWNVFNFVDNQVKLLLDGVNPFNKLDRLLQRYTTYSPEMLGALDALDTIRGTKFWNLSTTSHKTYQEALQKLLPKQALGTFGEELFTEAKPSFLQKLPISKQTIDWNRTLAGRIEMPARARKYLASFFEYLDKGYDDIVKRVPQVKIGDTTYRLSGAAVEALRARLRRVRNPTVNAVTRAVDDLLLDGEVVITPRLGADFGETLAALPTDIVKGVQKALDDLAVLSTRSEGKVTRAQIVQIFDDAAEQIRRAYDETVQSGIRAFEDTLPELPESTDETYRLLVRSEKPSLEELMRAIDDMPALARRASLENQKASQAHWNRIRKLKAAKAPPREIAEAQDAFLLQDRPAFWEKFQRLQHETATRIMDQVDELLAAAGREERFPRELMEQYLDAGKALTDAQLAQFQAWHVTMQKLRAGSLTQDARDALFNLTRKQVDEEWARVYPAAKAQIHDSLVQIREWFLRDALDITDVERLEGLGKGVDWWRLGQQIDDIPLSSKRQVQPMLADLERWRDEVLTRRVRPVETSPLTAQDKLILQQYRDILAEDVMLLVDQAVDTAIEETNHLFFDYETTQNWMKLLGEVYPFVRFPAKNIPLWIEKFTEVPHLVETIINLRELQAAYNKDLPPRLRYTVKLPQTLVNPMLEALGFHNTELRFNPWSFLSIMQQMPGATAYSQRRLLELTRDDEDEHWSKNLEAFQVISDELGFGMWPYLEWALGMFGLLGDDWYPRDALGTWSPVVNWALKEVFGYDKNFDIDVAMRKNVPLVWNALFGNTPLAWEQLNPDLMLDWATGREVEGLIQNLPDPVVAALVDITPADARKIVASLQPEQLEAIRQKILPIFDMPAAQQAGVIPTLSPEEQAVFLSEMQAIAQRLVIRKRAFSTIFGNMTGIYAQPVNTAEYEARKVRMERRELKESMEPGQERRDVMEQWYAEHPKYSMIQTWRFGEYPWATTAAGEVAEKVDALVDNYKTKYYKFNREWKVAYEKAIEETYRKYPGNVWKLREVKDSLRKQKEDYIDMLNEELNKVAKSMLEDYIARYPTDRQGIKALREGWEVDVYSPITLSEEDRQKLAEYRRLRPDDEEGYSRLFSELYEEARKRQPPSEKRKVPGLDQGLQLNIEWSPVGNVNYTVEEVEDFLIGSLLGELYDKAPVKDDFASTKEYWIAYNEYLDRLPEMALETEQGKRQVEQLIVQGVPEQAAREIVASWYTKEELYDRWQRNDTIFEALESVYQWRYISEADDEWYDEILPLRETDYETYRLRREDLRLRYSEIPATELIKYILEDYPGRWTQAELEQAFEGLVLPSYFDRMRLRNYGAEAVDSAIWHYYGFLTSEQKRQVREQFGPMFSDYFLDGETDDISVNLRGQWANMLAQMVGDTQFDWRNLPGVMDETERGVNNEAAQEGVPTVPFADTREFQEAQRLNDEYWRLRLANDPRYQEIAQNPLYQKYFGGSTAKSYFWNLYYSQIPPGPISKPLRDHPLIAFILDSDIRQSAATNSDYDRASRQLEEWLKENANRIARAGLDPQEYEAVRAQIKEYFAIPPENRALRRQYLNNHPLLRKYFEAADVADGKEPRATTSRGGGKKRKSKGSEAKVKAETKDVPSRVKDAATAFWRFYYEQVPPGSFARTLRDSEAVRKVMETDAELLTEEDYQLALQEMEAWLESVREALEYWDLNPEDYELVRDLMAEYFAIPEQYKWTRRQFLEDNPLLKKYFEAQPAIPREVEEREREVEDAETLAQPSPEAKEYETDFWRLYYEQVPPGGFSKSLRDYPLITQILSGDRSQLTPEDWAQAIAVIQEWLHEYALMMEAWGLNPADFEQVRNLMGEYFAIPQEYRWTRRKFLKEHPLLKRYFEATTDYIPGAEQEQPPLSPEHRAAGERQREAEDRLVSRGAPSAPRPVANYGQLWQAFLDRVGSANLPILRILVNYSRTGFMSPDVLAYLRKLHAEIGGGLPFEQWLSMLQAMAQRHGGDRVYTRRREVPSPPKVRYEKTVRGIRR